MTRTEPEGDLSKPIVGTRACDVDVKACDASSCVSSTTAGGAADEAESSFSTAPAEHVEVPDVMEFDVVRERLASNIVDGLFSDLFGKDEVHDSAVAIDVHRHNPSVESMASHPEDEVHDSAVAIDVHRHNPSVESMASHPEATPAAPEHTQTLVHDSSVSATSKRDSCGGTASALQALRSNLRERLQCSTEDGPLHQALNECGEERMAQEAEIPEVPDAAEPSAAAPASSTAADSPGARLQKLRSVTSLLLVTAADNGNLERYLQEARAEKRQSRLAASGGAPPPRTVEPDLRQHAGLQQHTASVFSKAAGNGELEAVFKKLQEKRARDAQLAKPAGPNPLDELRNRASFKLFMAAQSGFLESALSKLRSPMKAPDADAAQGERGGGGGLRQRASGALSAGVRSGALQRALAELQARRKSKGATEEGAPLDASLVRRTGAALVNAARSGLLKRALEEVRAPREDLQGCKQDTPPVDEGLVKHAGTAFVSAARSRCLNEAFAEVRGKKEQVDERLVKHAGAAFVSAARRGRLNEAFAEVRATKMGARGQDDGDSSDSDQDDGDRRDFLVNAAANTLRNAFRSGALEDMLSGKLGQQASTTASA